MTAVEPKIAERRQRVSEDRARRRLRNLILVLLVTALVVVAWWLLRSPVLSVRSLQVEGAVRSDPVALAATVGVAPGLPTISVDEAAVHTALLTDPWIAAASVAVHWPGTVVISVTERVPAAAVSDGTTTVVMAGDGTVLSAAGGEEPLVEVTVAVPAIGQRLTDPATLGALAFLAELPAELRRGAVVTVAADEITATVAGHPIRLGRPDDMEQKARTLAALLDTGLEDAVLIDLIAPLHPAVTNPRPEVEGEGDGPSEGEASG